MLGKGSAEAVSFLIHVRANVDEEFRIGLEYPVFWLLLNVSAALHRVSPSRWTSLAYHHDGATPLIFSILNGCYEATSVLLAAGARVDVQNYRRKTAVDLAGAMCAPGSVIKALTSRESRALPAPVDEEFEDCLSI
mmetsp:Transcript_23153/g.40938  ORF Transcript_23153/g.40938 Transcript_23153/m.40938 type:complete len:136 (+) Transcript_23153:1-408(+)